MAAVVDQDLHLTHTIRNYALNKEVMQSTPVLVRRIENTQGYPFLYCLILAFAGHSAYMANAYKARSVKYPQRPLLRVH